MENKTAILYGQVQTSLGFASLSSALNEMGVASRVGESSHYAGGCYLRIARDEAELTFERIEDSEYLIGGEAPSAEDLNELAKSVSDVLRRLAQKHRFEIYLSSEPSRMVGYIHHDWPLDEQLR